MCSCCKEKKTKKQKEEKDWGTSFQSWQEKKRKKWYNHILSDNEWSMSNIRHFDTIAHK